MSAGSLSARDTVLCAPRNAQYLRGNCGREAEVILLRQTENNAALVVIQGRRATRQHNGISVQMAKLAC